MSFGPDPIVVLPGRVGHPMAGKGAIPVLGSKRTKHRLIIPRPIPYTCGMTEPHVVTAPVAKRAELSGELAKLDERRAAINADIANLDAVLRLFCYAGEPAQPAGNRKTLRALTPLPGTRSS